MPVLTYFARRKVFPTAKEKDRGKENIASTSALPPRRMDTEARGGSGPVTNKRKRLLPVLSSGNAESKTKRSRKSDLLRGSETIDDQEGSNQGHTAALRRLALIKEEAKRAQWQKRRDRKHRALAHLERGGPLLAFLQSLVSRPSLTQSQPHSLSQLPSPPLVTSTSDKEPTGGPLVPLRPPAAAAAAAATVVTPTGGRGGTATERATEESRAEWEAWVAGRVAALQREGLWSGRRATKVPEPPRGKAHWDYLLEEMAWMAHDFAEERRFKMALARRVSKEVLRYHQVRRTREEREARKEEQGLRRQATIIAREVLAFWQSVEKLVRHKHQIRLDQRKREALDKHLDFLVGQTERYSTMLAEELAPRNEASGTHAPRAELEQGKGKGEELQYPFIPPKSSAVTRIMNNE
jgi:hypothetical protein